MNRILKWLKPYNTKVTTAGFGMFRIAFSVFLLVLIYHVFYFRPLIFNTIPHIAPNPFPAKLFLSIWVVVVVFLLVGWQTKVVAFVNYLFVIIAAFSFSNSGCGSFNDDLLRIGSFLMIIMPVGKSYSVDTIFYTIKYGQRPSNQTTQFYYLAALFVSLGLMYFASSFTKLYSPVWNKGLGLWIPSVMPHNKWNGLTFYLNWKWALMSINYLTIVWELGLIFALFFKKIRPYAAWLGIFFHLGIAAMFPFPLLCFGPIPFYLLFIGDRFWCKFSPKQVKVSINPNIAKQVALARLVSSINPNTKIIEHDTNNVLINKIEYTNNWKSASAALKYSLIGKIIAFFLKFELVRLLIDLLVEEVFQFQQSNQAPRPFFSAKASYGILLIFCIGLFSVQTFYSTYHFYSRIKGDDVSRENVKKFYVVRRDISDYSLKPSNLFRTLFGLNARGVFLDHSLLGEKTVFAITQTKPNGEVVWLPFFDENGYCQSMNLNLAWSKYSFNSVCSGNVPNPKELEKALWFWAAKNHIKTDSLNFNILKRTYHFPSVYQENYHQTLTSQPWIPEGSATFRKGIFNYHGLDSL